MQFGRVIEVFVTMARVMMTTAIGAVLGLERRLDGVRIGAQLFQHGLEHIVIEQAQPAIADLQGDMAIAQVIGRAGQFKGVAAGDMQQLFRARADTYDASVLGLQEFAIVQRRLPTLQKQADVFTVGTETAQAALAAGFEVQQQLGGPEGLGGDSAVDHQHRRVSSY